MPVSAAVAVVAATATRTAASSAAERQFGTAFDREEDDEIAEIDRQLAALKAGRPQASTPAPIKRADDALAELDIFDAVLWKDTRVNGPSSRRSPVPPVCMLHTVHAGGQGGGAREDLGGL